MPSHFWCQPVESPFMVLKKMKLSSQRSRLVSPHADAHVGGAAADGELELETPGRVRFCRSG